MLRLKDYIQNKYPELSRREIKRALDRGACLVNGKIERFATREIDPRKDKIVYKYMKPQAKARLEIQKDRIVFEDEHLLVYNKNGAYPALATKKEDRANIHVELKNYLAKREGKKVFLQPAHRLDKDTSGLMIFCKNEKALQLIFEQFREREIKKEYEAILDGILKKKEGSVNLPMKQIKKGAGWQRWGVAKNKTNEDSSSSIKAASTDYKLVKNYQDKNYSHVKLSPRTGRMHQIRVHMAHLGHAVVGDSFYCEKFKCDLIPDRHLLHASSLKFMHPITKQGLKLCAPLPKDMKKLI